MAKIKRGDMVLIIAGKDKGKAGKILKVAKGGQKVFVEKLNMVKRHTKPSQQNPHGGIVDKEAALDRSNVMLLTSDNRPVRVGYTIQESADGKRKKVRVGRWDKETHPLD